MIVMDVFQAHDYVPASESLVTLSLKLNGEVSSSRIFRECE